MSVCFVSPTLGLLHALILLQRTVDGNKPSASGMNECPCMEVNLTDPCVAEHSLCYPEGYGSSRCEAWDEVNGNPACSVGGRLVVPSPAWCKKQWCFVNTSNCQVRYNRTYYWPSQDGLAYSYVTCGAIDLFREQQMLDHMKGKVIKAKFLEEMPTVVRDAEGNWGGPLVEIYGEIAKRTNSKIVEVPISNASLTRYPAFTACVHDVAMGLMDVCIGAFWETPQRRLMSNFITAYSHDVIRLAVPFKVEENFDTWKMFAPFDNQLWAALIGGICLVGLVLFLIEMDVNRQGFLSAVERARDDRRRQALEVVEAVRRLSSRDMDGNGAHHRKNRSIFKQHSDTVKHLLSASEKHIKAKRSRMAGAVNSVFIAMNGFVGAAQIYQPATFAGRIAGLSYGIFILIMVSAYAASLTEQLITTSRKVSQVNSIDEAIAQNLKVCTLQSLEKQLVPILPNAFLFFYQTTDELYAQMRSNNCDALLVGEETHLAYDTGCTAMTVGSPIATMNLAQPSEVYTSAMGYYMTILKSEGYVDTVLSRARAVALAKCKDLTATEQNKYTLKDCFGAFVLLGFGVGSGVVLHLIRISWRRLRKGDMQRQISEEDEDESEPTGCDSERTEECDSIVDLDGAISKAAPKVSSIGAKGTVRNCTDSSEFFEFRCRQEDTETL